jgi:hypothetical protein
MSDLYVTALPGIHLLGKYNDDEDGSESKNLVHSFRFGKDFIFASATASRQKISKTAREIVDALPSKITIEGSNRKSPSQNYPIIISESDKKGFKSVYRPDIVEVLHRENKRTGVGKTKGQAFS